MVLAPRLGEWKFVTRVGGFRVFRFNFTFFFVQSSRFTGNTFFLTRFRAPGVVRFEVTLYIHLFFLFYLFSACVRSSKVRTLIA